MNWSWLVTLICPLMMIFMMFGMRGGHGHGTHKKHSDMDHVQKELAELKAQNEFMQKEILNLQK